MPLTPWDGGQWREGPPRSGGERVPQNGISAAGAGALGGADGPGRGAIFGASVPLAVAPALPLPLPSPFALCSVRLFFGGRPRGWGRPAGAALSAGRSPNGGTEKISGRGTAFLGGVTGVCGGADGGLRSRGDGAPAERCGTGGRPALAAAFFWPLHRTRARGASCPPRLHLPAGGVSAAPVPPLGPGGRCPGPNGRGERGTGKTRDRRRSPPVSRFSAPHPAAQGGEKGARAHLPRGQPFALAVSAKVLLTSLS